MQNLRSCSRLLRVGLLPLFIARPVPRGDGNEPQHQRENPADVVARYNGDAVRMAGKLSDVEHDNYNYRVKINGLNRDLKNVTDERDALKGKVPPEGTVVLTGEQVKAWEALQGQGEGAVPLPKAKAALLEAYEKHGTPEEVAAKLASGATAQVKNAKFERAECAKLEKMKPGVLEILGKDLDIQEREFDVTDSDGKTSKVKRGCVITKEGDKENAVTLESYFKAQGEDVLSTLLESDSGSGGGQQGGGQQGEGQQSGGGGVQFPAQRGGTSPKLDTSAIDNFAMSQYGHNLPQTDKK